MSALTPGQQSSLHPMKATRPMKPRTCVVALLVGQLLAIHVAAQENGRPAPANIGTLLNQQSAERARDLPVLYSVPGTEAEQGRQISATAKALLRNFTYTEYPDAEHADVWLKAQSALFDFFDKYRAAPIRGVGKSQ